MSKQKQEQTETKAQEIARTQKVGYLSAKEYQTFRALCVRIGLKFVEVKMGEVLKVIFTETKLFTENE